MDELRISCGLTIFLVLLMIPSTAQSQSSNHVSLGSVLVAGASNSTSWKSPNGDFALGFQPVANAHYVLAVVFDKIPNKTVVWVAKRDDNPAVEKGSKLQLSTSGALVLTDPRGGQLWTAGAGAAYGAMLDTGNFVLPRNTSNNSDFLWQSFNNPTDTLLPGQVLSQNGSLFSNWLKTDYSRGQFELIMQSDANFVLYTINYPTTDILKPYWASNTYQTAAFKANFNQSGYLFLTAENGTIMHYIFTKTVSASKFYQRLTLEFDGVLTHYSYPKSSNSTGVWSVENFIPLDNICHRVGGSLGGGVCGFNSVCSLSSNDQSRPNCSCPEGYSFVDPTKPMAGCEPDFFRQRCSRNSSGDVFKLVERVNTEWLDSAYEYSKSVTEDWCTQSCLVDCFCDAAFFKEGECWKNSIPLRHGRFDDGRGGKSYVKVPAK